MAEDHYFTNLFAGQGYPDVWRELGHDGTADWEFRTTSTTARSSGPGPRSPRCSRGAAWTNASTWATRSGSPACGRCSVA
jgi:hypothetical protein